MKKIILGIIILGILCSGCMSRDFEMDWDELENMTTETEGQTDDVPETEWETTLEEKSPYISPLMWRSRREEYSSFYCVDYDHDGENEIILVNSDGTMKNYLTYAYGSVYEYSLDPIPVDGMELNKNGFFQKIEYVEGEVVHVELYDWFWNNELTYINNVPKYNGEVITEERCEELLNLYFADSAQLYELTESNINTYAKLEMEFLSENSLSLKKDKSNDVIILPDSQLSLMQKALLGKTQIYDTTDNKMKWVWELPGYYDDSRFQCCDFDGDGKEEVILKLNELSVLHEKDGVIYRYSESSRSKIHEDGSIMFTSGASSWMLVIVKEFTNEEIVYETIYQYEDNICYKQYIYNGECILMTEEELAAIHEQYKEVKAELYENNYVNIINIIP